ncbi:MAG: hypothetical protein DRP54_07005 [Spirochaetes bacterium]|nr:MAG: hypothetical protein DRP54_07005 [Spirochaetota bacterium]
MISKKLYIKIFILLIVFLIGISITASGQKLPIGEPINYNIPDSIKVPATLKIKSNSETITAKTNSTSKPDTDSAFNTKNGTEKIYENLYRRISLFEEKQAEEKQATEKESSLRRFEIIFFISLPVSAGFSLAGILGYRAASDKSGSFSSAEYIYLALSSIGISLSIAFNDYLILKRKPG